MAERYYEPGLSESLGEWTLEGDEAHHLLRVRRGKVGERVQLFDGQGLRADATVREIGKRSVRLELANFRRSPPSSGLILGSAPPKGDRLLWMIEKCTELGVRSWTPVLSERTVVHPGDAKIEKLRRKVIEACKQCGRDDLMEIGELTPLPAFLTGKPWDDSGWLLDPSGEAPAEAAPMWACIGPEGGWTAEESAVARAHGWMVRSLPGRVLRIETACLAVAALGLGA